MFRSWCFKGFSACLIILSYFWSCWAQQPTLKLPFPNGYKSAINQQTGDCFSHCDDFTRYDIDLDTNNFTDEVVVAAQEGIAYVIADANDFGNHVHIDHG